METDSKTIILSRTIGLLLEKGYDGVSISDIQASTGMARGLLYHYFGNKKALFVAAAKKYLCLCFDTDTEATKTHRIAQMIDYTIAKYEQICNNTWADFPLSEKITIVDYDFLFYRLMQEDAGFEQQFSALLDKEQQAWQQVAQNSIDAGEIRSGLDPATIASFATCIMNGAWFQGVSNRTSPAITLLMRDMLQQYYNLIRKQTV